MQVGLHSYGMRRMEEWWRRTSVLPRLPYQHWNIINHACVICSVLPRAIDADCFPHRVIILHRGSICLAREREESGAIIPDRSVQRHSVTSLETERSLANVLVVGGGGWGRSMYSAFPGNCSVSYLSFVFGRSLWAELNGVENSLHWKANMLPLFSIMTLWLSHI